LKRIRKKRMAKENAAKKKMPGVSWEALERQFVDFKEHLRKRYGNGNLVRAWRVALSETMILPKTRFLKACVGMGYAQKAKELWKVLDKDESGFASIDELDPKSAKVLAHFKNSLDQRFSSIALAFDFLDVDGTRKIRRSQFEAALRRLEFPFPERASELFECLDLNGNHVLEEDDIQFLEKWRPAPILTAEKNPKAREEFRELLLQRYGRPVKAWRHLLDRDGSNRCNWHEFLAACKVIGFKGDLAGAWRALDDDLSGYITLKELDKEGYRSLWDFRTWAVDEFGSARAAFSVFDSDGSNSLSSQEFRAACRIYGYDAEGQIKQLFNTLDVSAEGGLLRRLDRRPPGAHQGPHGHRNTVRGLLPWRSHTPRRFGGTGGVGRDAAKGSGYGGGGGTLEDLAAPSEGSNESGQPLSKDLRAAPGP